MTSFFSFTSRADSSALDEIKIQEGLRHIKSFGMILKKNLVKNIKSEGLEAGFLFCNENADFLKTKWEKINNKLIGRVSDRARNSENKTPSWMMSTLDKYKKSSSKNKLTARLLTHNKNDYVVKPIYMKGVCLKCHGSKIPLETKKLLEEKYPKDKAIGYKEGDFRGLFWVKL